MHRAGILAKAHTPISCYEEILTQAVDFCLLFSFTITKEIISKSVRSYRLLTEPASFLSLLLVEMGKLQNEAYLPREENVF